ncbi:MAG: acetoin utilization protein AcuC [Thermoproteota archaeon]|jgi:Deacetylases, including yeast histone deacetylase and acetoin utilization protein
MLSCKIIVTLGENLNYAFPDPHPLNKKRYELFLKELRTSNILKEGYAEIIEGNFASEENLLLFHSKSYIEFVKRMSEYGSGYLDYGDTPVFKGVFEASSYVVGSTLIAIDKVFENKNIHAFNPIGGLHHAFFDRAAGFCVFNDPAIAIIYARKKYGIKKILYFDIDAHHGDGVYYSFESDPYVYIVDFHESGNYLFPGTGFDYERGKGEAYNTKLNIPLEPFSGTKEFLREFEKVKEFLKDKEFDLILFQCGTDGMKDDPITHLEYTETVHFETAKYLHRLAHERCKGRIVAMGGGGYNPENVAKGWMKVIEAMTKLD